MKGVIRPAVFDVWQRFQSRLIKFAITHIPAPCRVFLLVELVLADSRARELAVRNLVRTSQPTKTGAQINNGR